jgi:Rad3-related DNA helicase
VVQAAGRVIRTQQDQGVVMLIDDRFGDNKVRQLLPRWWSIASAAVQMDGLSHTAELQHPM